jgi:PAS domain S-box-containing protein
VQGLELEKRRHEVLAELDILDTPPEPAFDHLTGLAKDLFDVPIALISLIDSERQWFKSCVGLDVRSTPREVAFCDIAIRDDNVMVVPDASIDERFNCNPLVTGAPHIQFYAGAPVRYRDVLIGTLCIIDRKARSDFGKSEAKKLSKLADAVSAVLVMRKEAQANLAIMKVREKERRTLQLVEEVAGVGQWSYNVKTGEVIWSDQVFHIHGLAVSATAPGYVEITQFYEDGGSALRSLVDQAISTGQGYEFTTKIRRPDGQVRDVAAKAVPLCAPGGQVETLVGVFQDVSEYHATIEKLEFSEARYKMLADNASDLVLQCDANGIVVYASASALRLTGIDPEQLVGQKWCELLHPDDVTRVPAEIRALMQKGAPTADHPLRYRFIHAQKGLRRLEGRPTLLYSQTGQPNGFVSIIRDITESLEAFEKREASEAQLRSLADHVPGKIAYWGADLRCRFANQLYKDWLGRSSEDIVGFTSQEVMSGDDLNFNLPLIEQALVGRRQSVERTRLRPSGELVYLWVQYIPDVAADGTIRGVYVLATDVSTLKLKELALENANVQLGEARRQAEAALEIKAQFLATMSHEIRTPLTTILGYANLLSNEDLSGEAELFARRINKAGQTLLGLINDVLDISRLESGQTTLNPSLINVCEIVQDIVDQFTVSAAANGLKIKLRFDDEVPAWQIVDGARLAQVLTNILGNACKFTSNGEVSISVSQVESDSGLRMRMEVCDPGPGLSENQIGLLFKRFQQLDAGNDRKHGGSGLGLAICNEVIELMQGHIGVTSDVATGSTFWFEIPILLGVQPPVEVEEGTALAFESGNRKILLVDDHTVNRQMIKALLSPYAAYIEEAVDGAEAVIKCKETRFDLVLMDIQMPKLDGIEATKAIRQTCVLNALTPIFALSATAMDQLPQYALDRLFDGMLTKPIDRQKFHGMFQLIGD